VILALLRDVSLASGPVVSILLFLALVKLLRLTVYIVMGAVFVQALLTWVNPYHPLAPFFEALTRPFLKPFQKAIPPIGGVDITPVLVLIACQLVLMLPVAWLEQQSLAAIARLALP
jgi:YggT family protein